ncbi:MAG: hypothetical protein OEW75_11375 [Cyclobacteriaceae bacterium]|nr:hypothetical protein [Cyclobacteriaceae bacterium]
MKKLKRVFTIRNEVKDGEVATNTFPQKHQNKTQLKTDLEKSIDDFNNISPHGKLGGLTPVRHIKAKMCLLCSILRF